MKALKYMMMGMLVSLTASCGNDWLDVESSTKIPTETAIQNLDDVEYSLNGIYDVMRSTNYYSGRMIYYGDVTGDDAQSIKTGKRTTSYYMLDYTKDSGPSSHWSYAYKIIQNCNIILSQIDGLDVSEDDTEYFNDLKGQTLALRGFALFDLTRFFGYPAHLVRQAGEVIVCHQGNLYHVNPLPLGGGAGGGHHLTCHVQRLRMA